MFGTAQTTPARQLPQEAARAYPHARRHAFVAATTPCSYSNGDPSSILSTAAEPAPSRYKREPRAPPSTQATSNLPSRAPQAVVWPGEVLFPNSGRFGRRQAPVKFVAASHSFAQPAPPVVSPSPCRAAQLPNFGRRPPEHKNHFTNVAPSAAELAAGDSFHLRRPSDHQGDRPSLAVPSPPSGAREEPPFVDGDRRRPPPFGQRERGGRKERSNLTSGPSGPTVSDPRVRPLWLSDSAKHRVRFLCCESVFPSKRFLFWFYLKKESLTRL